MERTVPYTASEEVELYLRTYYSLLRSTSEVQIRTLEEVHSGMNSLLHPGARSESPDMSAFIYCLLRLPDCVHRVRTIVLGQSTKVFVREGIGDIETWEVAVTRARRRRCYYNGKDVIACIIASRSDIDDVVPMLTAYQIEWNKLHRLLKQIPFEFLNDDKDDPEKWEKLAIELRITIDDLTRLQTIWGFDFFSILQQIATKNVNFHIRLLSGSLSDYRRATHAWWQNIETKSKGFLDRPIYFVSSNTHSLVNLVSGFALQHREELLNYLETSRDQNLLQEWADIQLENVPSRQENFLYYILKKYLQTPDGLVFRLLRDEFETENGVIRIDSEHFFDVDVQIIDISGLNPDQMDARLCDSGGKCLSASDAIILNIDYPLGLGAYHILSKVSEHANEVLGVYILGKAATLNGVIGDVMITNVVHDEHSKNTYIFPNAFSAADITPYLVYGTVLDNQKSVTVRGTILQNADYMDVFYREGYTDIEMEAGPFLSAVYEMFRPNRHPVDEIVNLYHIPFDLGVLHYASDTPLSKGRNLGASTLSYFGMDPTYATSIAILRRIFLLEENKWR